MRVYNVDPAVTVTASGPIRENDSTTLTGTISDPGTLDTFDVAISWGDGSSQTLSLSAGSTSFTASHTYVDDDPTGTPSDNYTITAVVTDDDTGVGSGSTFVTVENVAPSLGDLSATSPIVEDGATTLSGTWTDPGTAAVLRRQHDHMHLGHAEFWSNQLDQHCGERRRRNSRDADQHCDGLEWLL